VRIDKKSLRRVLMLAVFLFAIGGVAHAFFEAVSVNAYRFTGNPTRSTVDVLVRNPYGFELESTLRLLVTDASGVPLSVVVRPFRYPAGGSTQRVFVPYDIREVRRAWLSNTTNPNH